MSIPGPSDTDQSGLYLQRERVYNGPTLGWAERTPLRSQLITTTGTKEVSSGVGIVYVNVAAVVTVNLPDLRKWMGQSSPNRSNGYEGAIWIKDLGYHAAAFNITVHPFSGQLIDGLAATDFTIVQDGQMLRLYPLNDLSGWIAG